MNNRSSLSKRVELLRKAYAPSCRKNAKRLKKQRIRLEAATSGVFSFSEKGKANAEVFCEQETAYEIISRDLDQTLAKQKKLLKVSYSGQAFLLKAKNSKRIAQAVKKLKSLIEEFRPKSPVAINNSGTADDLCGVVFSDDIEFLGGKECVFCGREIKAGEMIRRTTCLHIFHMECISPWLSSKQVCPIDKMPI